MTTNRKKMSKEEFRAITAAWTDVSHAHGVLSWADDYEHAMNSLKLSGDKRFDELLRNVYKTRIEECKAELTLHQYVVDKFEK